MTAAPGGVVPGSDPAPEEPGAVLSPSAGMRDLGDRELAVLAQVGHHWANAVADPRVWQRALPVDPDLQAEAQVGRRREARFAGVEFRPKQTHGRVEATERATAQPSPAGQLAHAARRAILGGPLRSTAVTEERMRKLIALPVLSSDALSSVAYGPEAMLVVLVAAGTSGLGLSLPIAGAIIVLMVAVGLSYRQTIRAYPKGGGSYIVASDNLGEIPGLVAAAGLMLDYVLTVAVSVAAGVAAVTSAIPSLSSHTVILGLGTIVLLLAGNLRGVRQAGALFAAPTYLFILAILMLLAVGLVDAAAHGFRAAPRPHRHATEGLGLLVVLRAFSSGATAMTGIEAISDGIPAFQPPEWRNARTTLTWMVGLLVAMFAGIMVLIELDGLAPGGSETLLSRLASHTFGPGGLYVFVQASTAAILLLAANTAFSDFPRLLFFLARDFHAPRIFLRMGDRLAFSNGIIVLSVAAGLLYAAFNGNTERLIPLFAVGVFLAFTLSQFGMVRFWLRGRQERGKRSLVINGVGALLSGLVLVVTALTKFTQGAWIVVVLVPLLVLLFLRIRRHYDAVGEAIRLYRLPSGHVHQAVVPTAVGEDLLAPVEHAGVVEGEESPDQVRHLVIVPVLSLDLPSMRTLAYAASLAQPVLAIHLSPDEDEAVRFRRHWNTWGDHLPLQIIDSPFRSVVVPTARYLEALHAQRPELTFTVVLPELIVRRWWHRVLHNQLAGRLRRVLRSHSGIVVSTVPFHLQR